MNLDYDEECGAAPGVMGHLSCTNRNCSCRSDSTDSESVDSYKSDYRQSNKHTLNYTTNRMAVPDSSWLKYAFIKRQTDKAILFAFQSSKGLFEHWVPKSLITGLQSEPNRVKIQQWFVTRNSLYV